MDKVQLPVAQVDLFERYSGSDAPGDDYCLRNDSVSRRAEGITLTPAWLVECMLDEMAGQRYDTIVDCGAGTGRFAIAAALHFPAARIIAVEFNPVLAGLLRQRAVEHGVAARIDVVEGDFREARIVTVGRTLFIGNPPYVRHHDIAPEWKAWYAFRMAATGIVASRLAGLHAHFVLRAVELMRPGDELCFVMSSEWLDNGYGSALRRLLGGSSDVWANGLWLSDAGESIFADALVSSVVIRARCGVTPATVATGLLGKDGLKTVRRIETASLAASDRWTPWCRSTLPVVGPGIEVGELFRVSRGQVTGLNEAWVIAEDRFDLPPEVCIPAVTRAKELIDGSVLSSSGAAALACVVDLPCDLDEIARSHRPAVDRFLARARALGAEEGYIARHRKRWYSVGMRAPPAAFVSYMGRRPPVFRANPWAVSFINVAHGLYPRQPVAEEVMARLLAHLNSATDRHAGRTYGGGMAKFEPGDVARLRVPANVLEGVD